MLRKALAILLLIAVAVVFLAAPEGDAVAWLDWLRDPDGSRRAHSEYVARERERERLEAERGEPDLDSSAPLLSELEASRAAGPAQDAPPSAAQDELAALLEASTHSLRGRLLALDGSTWPDVTVSAHQPGRPPQQSSSDEFGRFQLELTGAGGSLAVDPTAWVLLAGELGLSPGLSLGTGPRSLVLAPRLDLRGRVLDGAGRPLAEVLVQVTVELAGRADLDLVALLPDRFEARARSAADGSFEIPGVPDLEHGRVLLRQGEGAPTLLGLPELRAGGDLVLPVD